MVITKSSIFHLCGWKRVFIPCLDAKFHVKKENTLVKSTWTYMCFWQARTTRARSNINTVCILSLEGLVQNSEHLLMIQVGIVLTVMVAMEIWTNEQWDIFLHIYKKELNFNLVLCLRCTVVHETIWDIKKWNLSGQRCNKKMRTNMWKLLFTYDVWNKTQLIKLDFWITVS